MAWEWSSFTQIRFVLGLKRAKLEWGPQIRMVSSNDTVCLHHLRLWSTAIEPSILSEVRVSPPSITCHTLGTRVPPLFQTNPDGDSIQHSTLALLPWFANIYNHIRRYVRIYLYIYMNAHRDTHTHAHVYIYIINYNTQSPHDAVFPIPRISRGRPR